MKYEWGNGQVKAIALRASWFLRVLLLFILHTSYFILSATAQQSRNPVPDTECECGGGALTPTPTNAGTNFLLCFEENTDPYYQSIYSADGYLGIYCASMGDLDTVTITCNRYPNFSKVFILQPNASFSYDITGDSLDDLWIVSDESVDNRVVQVHSSAPVVCYGLDYKRWSADAFCALPQEYSGTEYRVMSYGSSSGEIDGGAASGEFAVAAFQDNTIVTITPTVLTVNGSAGGVSEVFTLQQGQCIQIQADTQQGSINPRDYLDLTGSTVTSNNPIAVYGGHVQTEIPDGFLRPSDQYVTRDMLLEAMPPTSAWGSSFVLAPVALDSAGDIDPDGDLMRVLALYDSTAVSVNGQPWVMLNHGQFRDSLTTSPTLVTTNSPNNPLLVAEMAHSSYTYYGPGDPFLAIVPPTEQTYNNYTFFLPADTDFSYQSVIVAANTNSESSILLDGALIPTSKFKPVPGTANGQAFAITETSSLSGYIGLPPGVHTITTTAPPEQGFTILGYGVGFANAYGYAAGELLVPKRAIMIEYPPVANGPVHTNVLSFHNTAYQPAYLDSAEFIPDDFKDQGYGIHAEENVATDIGRMDIGGQSEIHLVSNIALMNPVSGTVKIYSHLPSYFGIEPGQMHFTLYPDASATVSQSNNFDLTVTAVPNPFSSYTTINFSIPQSIVGDACDVTITLYDELGRVVRTVASSEFSTGPYSVRIDHLGLANGVYTCMIVSERLNIHARIPVVAVE
jgi:hypothetical protein